MATVGNVAIWASAYGFDLSNLTAKIRATGTLNSNTSDQKRECIWAGTRCIRKGFVLFRRRKGAINREKTGPQVDWFSCPPFSGNVELVVAKNVGQETVQYVRNIYRRIRSQLKCFSS